MPEFKRHYVIYCSFPYSSDPEKNTELIKTIAREIYAAAKERGNDLILLIPHTVFDCVYNFPVGSDHEWMCESELYLISLCDAVAYDPLFSSAGVMWETKFAELIRKPILTYNELKAGKRP